MTAPSAPGLAAIEYFKWLELLARPVADVVSLNPQDRLAALPAWCVPELVATPESCERLRAWAAAGGPRPDQDLVHVVGGDLEAEVRATLETLPAPVLDHLGRHAFILATGRNVSGWCAKLPAPRADASEGLRVLVVTWRPGPEAAADFRSLLLHETAHHWLELGAPRDRAPVAAAAVREARDHQALTLKLGAEWGLLYRLTEPAGAVEHRACRLAARWGATGVAADGCTQAAFVRRLIAAEAAAAEGLES
jgi:hypothetical protein